MKNERLKYTDKRRKSALIKFLILLSGHNYSEAANMLGISKAYFQNKLNRDSFDISEIAKIAEWCGYKITISNHLTSFNLGEWLKEGSDE